MTRSVQCPQWRISGVFYLVLACVTTLLLSSSVLVVHATLANTKVAPVSLVAGALSGVVVTFTSSVELRVGDQVMVQFPSGFSLSTTTSMLAVDSSLYATTLTIASLTIDTMYATTDSSAVSAGSSFQFTLTDVTNPPAGTTGAFMITTCNSSSAIIDTDNSVQTVSIKSSSCSMATIAPDSLDAGVTGLATVTFTSDVALPIGSKIVVTFPSEFGVGSTSVVAVASLHASSTVAMLPSSEVVVTIAGSAIASGSTVEFQLDGITNPGAATTGSFSLESRTSADKVYQQDAAIAPAVITSTTFSAATMSPASVITGVIITLSFELQIGVNVALNGYFTIDVPTEVSIPASAIVFQEQVSGAITTGSFAISTADPRGYTLQKATIPGLAIVPGNILDAQFKALLPHHGVPSQVQVVFKTSAELAQDSFSSQTTTVSFSLPSSGVETQGDLNEESAIELLVKDMINLYSEQLGLALSLATVLADSGYVDESNDVVVNATVSSSLAQTGSWISSVTTPGVESTQTITLKTGGSLEPGASFCFSLVVADGWAVSLATVALLSVTSSDVVLMEQTMSWSAATRLLCAEISVALPQESDVEFQFTQVRSPPSIRAQTTATVLIRSHLGGLVNSGSIGINSITKGALTGALLWQSLLFAPGPVAGLETSAILSFQCRGRILSGGLIMLTLPAEWTLDPACKAKFMLPAIAGTVARAINQLQITLSDAIDHDSEVKVLISGVKNPPSMQPSSIALLRTYASDGGVIGDSAALITLEIVSELISIESIGDTRTAIIGEKKKFRFEGHNVAKGDVVKFVDASTTSDLNCGDAATGVSDAGGIDVAYLTDTLDVEPEFSQSSPDNQPFAICYKFGSNPFKLYSNLGFTVKEILAITVNVGMPDMAVANYPKAWSFLGRGVTIGDQVRWINTDVVGGTALLGLNPPDCTDPATRAKLAPITGVALGAQEDDYTRVIESPSAAVFMFDEQNAGNTFCLCYKFGNEPYKVYPSISIQVNHLRSVDVTASGSKSVAVVDASKSFKFIGEGLLQNDRVYFIESGSATSCAPSSTTSDLRIAHTIAEQPQTVLFMDATLKTAVNFTDAAAGKKVLPCYQFGSEPYMLYPSILIEVKMVTTFTGKLGSPLLAVANVPEPLTFQGCGLLESDQVRWILRGEEDCESNLASLVSADALEPIDTIVLDATRSGVFNFTDTQVDFNPALCYKFGTEEFKLYTNLRIRIGTVRLKSTLVGEKDVAVVAARKVFTLYGMNLAEDDRVGWTTNVSSNCADLSLLIRNPLNLDSDYMSYATVRNEFGVALASLSSGKRVYMCYGFGNEPLKLYANLYLDVKSILNMRSLLGSSDAVVAGALKTFLFEGDGVTTGDFAKFVPVSKLSCDEPGILLTNIIKEFDDYAEMAMYLYENVAGVTVGSFRFGSDTAAAGLNRVLCYRFGSEPFFFYDIFHIDVKTIWGLRQFDRSVGGQDDVAVVNERKLVTIDGVGMSVQDQVKFVNQHASSDQDCLDLAAQGLIGNELRVFKNLSMWLPFELDSNNTEWKLCYKFDTEPFRLHPDIGVNVKEVTDLLDFDAITSAAQGRVATISQKKTWSPVGSGIYAGDSAKFVSSSVLSSADCGESNSNIAGGIAAMKITSSNLVFSDEPNSYIRNFELKTYGILGIDRNVFLAQAATPVQVSGFRLSNTDRLGWTTTNCTSVFAITDVIDQQTTVWFTTAYDKLSLCYSFDRQPFSMFSSISVSVVNAEIWIPQTVSVVADQEIEMTAAGTFGLAVSSDQIA
ncbi:hypothetical protein FI667_g5698, partial [Globisporangium splendens]